MDGVCVFVEGSCSMFAQRGSRRNNVCVFVEERKENEEYSVLEKESLGLGYCVHICRIEETL